MSSEPLIILGIDPGTIVTGYGILLMDHTGVKVLDFGAIKPHKKAPLSERYVSLFEGVRCLVENFKPTALAGFCGASKFQVQSIMQQLLGLYSLPEPEDAADALAIALCHLHRSRLQELIV